MIVFGFVYAQLGLKYVMASVDMYRKVSVFAPDETFQSPPGRDPPGALTSFHPEIALFRNLCVNLRNYLCGVPLVRLRAIP